MRKREYIILIFIIFMLYSCYEDPMGVGVADMTPPTVQLLYPSNQSEFNDSDFRIEYKIVAEDFWGIRSSNLVVNDNIVQQKDIIGATGFSSKLLVEGNNKIYAFAIDNYGNYSASDTANIRYTKTIKIVNPSIVIELLDSDLLYTLNLNTLFYDSHDNTTEFEFTKIIENSSGNWLASITDSILTIHTFKYFKGSGTIIITAAKSDGRSAELEIPLIVNTSEEFNWINIPDANFRRILYQYYNFTFDGENVVEKEVLSVDSLTLAYGEVVEDFEGLQYFINLTYLNISGGKIKNVDFSKLTRLRKLESAGCEFIEDLDLSPLVGLEEINLMFSWFYFNFDFSHNINLKKISISSNMETIDLSNNLNLESLYFEGMQRIDISNNVKLKKLKIHESLIGQINLTNNTELNELDITRTSFSELDLRNNQELVFIRLNDNFQLKKVVVWELPLPSYIYVEKEEHNEFVTEP